MNPAPPVTSSLMPQNPSARPSSGPIGVGDHGVRFHLRLGQRCPVLPFDDAKGSLMQTFRQAFPSPQGLYDGAHEHDACGVAFVATLTGEATHDIVAKAIQALRNLEHRGAVGAEP